LLKVKYLLLRGLVPSLRLSGLPAQAVRTPAGNHALPVDDRLPPGGAKDEAILLDKR
jgi:hypothetical protein